MATENSTRDNLREPYGVQREILQGSTRAPLLSTEKCLSKPKGPSRKSILAELRGPQRLWTAVIAAQVVSLSPLLGGYTLGFASPALLQLNDPGVPAELHLEGAILAIFAVRFTLYLTY